MCSALFATALLSFGGLASGQAAAASGGTGTRPEQGQIASAVPQAVDPLLVKPVSELTPEQIEGMQKKLADWPNLHQFREDNDRLPPAEPGRVVFFGDSITIAWKERDGNSFFPGKPYINRGISGQTTPQMVVRFQQDVVALKPAAVVILAGINDLAGNTGPMTLPMTEDNFRSMVAIAQANGIRVILSSVLPANHMAWRNNLNPAQQVRDLNAWLQKYAAAHGCTWLDYYSALVDGEGGMKPGLSKDGVHPTPAGYAIMAPLAEAAIERTLRTSPAR
ncbi:SGNH/GDSL hydrolase family protein [Terriglobus aquaticus]|uniref:SGNH/GDSL hydrolase family protein n=1 Tax=Terriglobus aquaticus TaxID=940139 RepID=A0ABW9KGJ5_9BACT|nr:SGNH/GDSL hydrolase family protein [Terriglobus aquaticus]